MLVDITLNSSDKTKKEMLGLVKVINDDSDIKRYQKGVYIIGHFNFEYEIEEKIEEYDDIEDCDTKGLIDRPYGVCDTPEQLLNIYDFEKNERKLVIALTPIYKKDQPPEEGWRWHKWGPYIGNKRKMCNCYPRFSIPVYEYLYDEPNVDLVYCFHIYEIK